MSPFAFALALVLSAGLPAGGLPRETIPESSGLARSPHGDGLWITHNDSGHPPRIFVIRRDGSLVATYAVTGGEALDGRADWEATATTKDEFFIADIGNNRSDRTGLSVLRLPAPHVDPGAGDPVLGTLAATGRVPILFADQMRVDEAQRRANYDAEALFAAGDSLWILSKHRADSETTLYRLPLAAFDHRQEVPLALEPLDRFDTGGHDRPYGGMVTSADADPSGTRLAVLTYHAIFVFAGDPGKGDWLRFPVDRIDLDQGVLGQCESILWDGLDLIVGNEAGALRRFVGEGRAWVKSR